MKSLIISNFTADKDGFSGSVSRAVAMEKAGMPRSNSDDGDDADDEREGDDDDDNDDDEEGDDDDEIIRLSSSRTVEEPGTEGVQLGMPRSLMGMEEAEGVDESASSMMMNDAGDEEEEEEDNDGLFGMNAATAPSA